MASVGEKPYDAAGDGDHKLVDKLIKEDGTAVNWKRDNGETPLHAAAIANHEKVVDSLLKANADPNAKNDDGESPLHYAAMNDSGDAGCAKKLIAAGAKRFENIPGKQPHQLAYDATKKEKPGKRKDSLLALCDLLEGATLDGERGSADDPFHGHHTTTLDEGVPTFAAGADGAAVGKTKETWAPQA